MFVLDDAALIRLLEEDCGFGDLTTETLGIGYRRGHFQFIARQQMRLCGVEEAVRLCCISGIDAQSGTQSGTSLEPGHMILEGTGSAANLHRTWKAAQVLIEWASGIATATAEIVAAANGVPVACTRKNFPGTKAGALKAVLCAGASPHRPAFGEAMPRHGEPDLPADPTAPPTRLGPAQR